MEDLASIRKRIEGKRVLSVTSNGSRLNLDDGTVLELYMSDSDCCAIAWGDWVIQPDSLDAIITDVRFDLVADREDNGDGNSSHATITVLHNQNPVALADCYANNGNGGYYYSILSLAVAVPGSEVMEMKVIKA